MQLRQEISLKSVDEYIALQPEKVRPHLEKLRQTIKNAAPGVKEEFTYQMPAYKLHGVIAWFAAFKKHYSLFIQPQVLKVFINELQEFELSKSAIRIPNDKPVPVRLVKKIIKFAANENLNKAKLKGKIK